MSPAPYPPRQVLCETCRRPCHSQRKDRDICRDCYGREPTTRCVHCGKIRHCVSVETGLCSHCAKQCEAVCIRCNQPKVIYNKEAQLCKICNQTTRQTARKRERRHIKVECSQCHKLRSSFLFGRAICRQCWTEERNGRVPCAGCGKRKVIALQSKQLCMHCNQDRLAPKALRRYITEFSTSYPYTTFLFHLLAATIEWQSVTQKIYCRFRAFGQFLRTHHICEPVTWESIEEMLPELGLAHRTTPKFVRMCLLDLGHLLVAAGKLESREVYVARRFALSPVQHVPVHIQGILNRYIPWLWEREIVPATVRDHLEVMASFWTWCDQHGIQSPEQVQISSINDYLQTLYWQWSCSFCNGRMDFEPHQRIPASCKECGAIRTLFQAERYAQKTVRDRRGKLHIFFDWAKSNHLVIVNPVQRKIASPTPTITHYPLDIIKQLCVYIAASNADPLEALILYLIIFHAFSIRELRYVEIPIHTLSKGKPSLMLAEDYAVVLPGLTPSRGSHSPGRSPGQLNFPQKAVSWLKPLLERYEQWRQQTVKNQDNRYLLIAPGRARHMTPVCHVFIWKIVRNASIRVSGAACNPNTLRKTVGVMFADKAGAGVLKWMGWDEQQAFKYTWVERTIIHPKREVSSQQTTCEESTPIVFPSPREGIKNDELL